MTNLQKIVDDAERRFPQAELDDALAEHLAPSSHPMPHPERFDHGYVKPASFVLDLSIKAKQDHGDVVRITNPGPITMAEPRKWHECTNWWIVGVIVAVVSFWGLVATSAAP